MHFAVFLCFSSMLDSNPFFSVLMYQSTFFFIYLFYFSWTSFYLEVLFFSLPVSSLSLYFTRLILFDFKEGEARTIDWGITAISTKFSVKKKKNCWLSICTSIQWQADWIKTSLGKNDFLRLFFLSLSNIILFMGMGRNWQIAMETIQSIWKYLPYNGKFRV